MALMAMIFPPGASGDNIDPDNNGSKYVWGENIGWLNFKPSQGPGVTVTDSNATGYIWGENIGWISLSCLDAGTCAAEIYGVMNDGNGNLSGYAWGENAGWINFAPTGGGVTINACGELNGYAWGENIGWISFRSDGAIPFKAKTAWQSPLDAIPPVTAYSPAVQPWYKTDAAFNFSATDCGKGPREVRYRINSGPEIITPGTSAAATVTTEVCNMLEYYAIDNANNVEPSRTLTVCIDKTPPSVNISVPVNGSAYYINQPLLANFSVTELLSGLASVTSTVLVGSAIYTAATGNYTFSVTATDNAGNTTPVTYVYSVIFPGNMDPGSTGCQHAWAENVGWINFKPSWGPGVTVSDTVVSGMAWGENIGWINLSPANSGVVNDGFGNLSGYAWGENVGWINFRHAGGGVSIGSDGKFTGYAWGENIGWINFSSSNSCVKTAWVSPNQPPIASNQTLTTPEDTPKSITLTATDPEGQVLTFTVLTGPAHGTLSGTPPNVTYTPFLNYNGPDSFTFKANDGKVDSNIATISITITPVNHAPVANSQSVTTNEDTQAIITLLASDVDGDTLTFSIVSLPSHGTLTGAAPNLTYMPAADYNGADSFTFKANDGKADSNIATVTITVNPVNDIPAVTLSCISPVIEGGTFTGSGSFVDPDTTDTWTATVNYGDGSGTQPLPLAVNKTFGLSHVYPDNGIYTVTVIVTDSQGAGGSGTFVVTVNNVAPVISKLTVTPNPVVIGGTLSASAAFTDAGILDTHTAQWNWGDGTTSAAAVTESNGAGTAAGSHSYGQAGTFTITLIATDKDGLVNSGTVQVQVMTKAAAAIQAIKDLENAINALPASAFRFPKLANSIKKLAISELNTVITYIQAGKYSAAQTLLKLDIFLTNGCARTGKPDPTDVITNCSDQAKIYPLLIQAVELVKSLTQ